MRRLLSVLLLAFFAVPAQATDPSSGKVSKASPKVTWTGSATGFAAWQLYNQQNGTCSDPSCDTFTLEVADGPANLALRVKSADSNMYLEVVKPDGSKELFGGASMDVKATIKNAPNGVYTLNIAHNEQTQGAHEGTAELVLPAAAPPPAPSAAPLSAPQPPIVKVRVGKVSARRAKKVTANLTTTSPVTSLKAVLLRGTKKVATGSLARLESSGRIVLKVKGRLKPGSHVLRVTGTDTAGREVSAAAKVRVAK